MDLKETKNSKIYLENIKGDIFERVCILVFRSFYRAIKSVISGPRFRIDQKNN